MPEAFFAIPDTPRGVIKLSGADRETFLQDLISNDVRLVTPGRAIWAALLTPQGKYLHDFFLAAGDDAFLLEVEGERLADLKRRLAMYKLRSKVVIEATTFEVVQAWGADAAAAFGLGAAGSAVAVAGGVAFVDPRLAALGLRLIVPQGTGAAVMATHGIASAQWSTWDDLRLGLGVPDGLRDMALEKAILLENGFDELHGVAWDKGCYIGQELTARTKYRGLVKKRLMPVTVDGTLPAPGTIITRDGQEAGEMRSGRDGRALALIRLDALDSTVPLVAGDTVIKPRKPDWAGF